MSEPLKATTAREITKESVTEAETLVVNGVSVSRPQQSPMQAGVFRPTVVEHMVKPSWFKRVVLRKSATVEQSVVTRCRAGLLHTFHQIARKPTQINPRHRPTGLATQAQRFEMRPVWGAKHLKNSPGSQGRDLYRRNRPCTTCYCELFKSVAIKSHEQRPGMRLKQRR